MKRTKILAIVIVILLLSGVVVCQAEPADTEGQIERLRAALENKQPAPPAAKTATSEIQLAQRAVTAKEDKQAEAKDVPDWARELQAQMKALEAKLTKVQAEKAELQATLKKVQSGQSSYEGKLEKLLKAKPAKPTDFRVYWKEGLRFTSTDEQFKLKVGGRLMYDAGWIHGADSTEDLLGTQLTDGTEVRRARLYTAGTIYGNIDFKLQLDFAGGDADLKDAYLMFKKIPCAGNVKIGHYKEPFSLEELTSSKYITFLERSLANTFAPGRNTGVTAYSHTADKRLAWALGGFRDTDGYGEEESERGYAVTGRMVGLPWYEEKGKRLLHLGAAYSFRDTDDGRVRRYRARPEYHLTERFVDTGSFPVDHVHLFGTEAALVCGPFSAQAEYIASLNKSGESGVEDACLNGFYVSAGYFLTGEHRPYKAGKGVFGRVKPKKNFGKDGCGAWQIVGRFSCLDLNDGPVRGGRLQNETLGLNWFVNPNVRFMWDYVHSRVDRNDEKGDADMFLMRAQVDF